MIVLKHLNCGVVQLHGFELLGLLYNFRPFLLTGGTAECNLLDSNGWGQVANLHLLTLSNPTAKKRPYAILHPLALSNPNATTKYKSMQICTC